MYLYILSYVHRTQVQLILIKWDVTPRGKCRGLLKDNNCTNISRLKNLYLSFAENSAWC